MEPILPANLWSAGNHLPGIDDQLGQMIFVCDKLAMFIYADDIKTFLLLSAIGQSIFHAKVWRNSGLRFPWYRHLTDTNNIGACIHA